MALNIPVNLMNAAVPPIQPSGAANAASDTISLTAVQPTSKSADTRGSASDGGGMNNSSSEQTALIFQQLKARPTAQNPDRAEPKSVVTAQADAPEQPAEPSQPMETAAEPESAQDAKSQSELDRYAPPNPLPTAPILKLAESYAAISTKEK